MLLKLPVNCTEIMKLLIYYDSLMTVYEGHLKSSWTRIISLSWNFVEVQ